MAYCNECGAYIPDGHSKCLACGFDEAEQAAKKADSGSQSANTYEYKYEEAKPFDSDFLRQQLEQQRKRQQENSRKWAEAEQAQRRKAQEENRKQYSAGARSTDGKKYSAPTNVNSSKIFSALSYFGILFIVPYLLCQNDDFARFHAKQGLILFLACLVGEVFASIFGFGWLVNLARIYFIYKGVSAAMGGRKEPLPYIGGLI